MTYKPFGTDPVLDKQVLSNNLQTRILAARNGYGLDVLKDDNFSYVREAVALYYKNITAKELDDDDIDILKHLDEYVLINLFSILWSWN